MFRRLLHTVLLLISIFPVGLVPGVQSSRPYLYLYPLPGSRNLNPGVTIAVRYGSVFQAGDLSGGQGAWFQVSGSASGPHSGKTTLSDDGSTLLFKPDQPFALGERVSVTIDPAAAGRKDLQDAAFSFEIRGHPAPAAPTGISDIAGTQPGLSSRRSTAGPAPDLVAKHYVTLPADFPSLAVTTPANGTAPGLLFTADFYWFTGNTPIPPSYLSIFDETGEPVFYQNQGPIIITDFKMQPNGLLTYYDGTQFVALNNAYQVVNTFQAGNGYPVTDLHDMQILPNGHALLIVYDAQILDMTAYGGSPAALVSGLVIQELDLSKNVVFEWRSWDHFQLTDTYVDLTTPVIDPIHANALELDQDGNILLSSRHTWEITKINRQTGAIIWRLGGKNNQFSLIGDPNNGFSWQHDIRRLPNGHITLFDNRTGATPAYSRGLEYQLDENAKTATLVWSYRNPLDTYTLAMGNVQRLPNGNSLIGWGSGPVLPPPNTFTNLTEVKPDGSKALEISLPAGYVSYRAFRFPWHGYPAWAPALVVQNQGGGTALYYSWNGATDVSRYEVYGSGKGQPIPDTLIADQAKTGFEDSTVLTGSASLFCYFQVKPLDLQGRPTRSSEIVPNPACFQSFPVFMPLVTGQ